MSLSKKDTKVLIVSGVIFLILAVVLGAVTRAMSGDREPTADERKRQNQEFQIKEANKDWSKFCAQFPFDEKCPDHEKHQYVPKEEAKQEPNGAAVIAAALNQQFQKDGSDVTVIGVDDVLIFNCAKALDPRLACYELYKGYPNNELGLQVLRKMGVRKIKFSTENGILSGYAWQKQII